MTAAQFNAYATAFWTQNIIVEQDNEEIGISSKQIAIDVVNLKPVTSVAAVIWPGREKHGEAGRGELS